LAPKNFPLSPNLFLAIRILAMWERCLWHQEKSDVITRNVSAAGLALDEVAVGITHVAAPTKTTKRVLRSSVGISG
jgi:hypothetical protein